MRDLLAIAKFLYDYVIVNTKVKLSESHDSESWYCFQHICLSVCLSLSLSVCVSTNQEVVLEMSYGVDRYITQLRLFSRVCLFHEVSKMQGAVASLPV